MEDNLHDNWNSIIYRKGALHRTEIEGPVLASESFNASLVQFLPPDPVIISNAHASYFTSTISHVHGRTPKTVLRARSLWYEK